MLLIKKIGILVGAFSLLVAVPVTIARNEKGIFFAQAEDEEVQGTYTLTINNTVEFDTVAKTASITKQIGSTTLEILNTSTLSFSNTNKLPITFSGVGGTEPRIRLAQVQNIRSVIANFSSDNPTSVTFRYVYLDIVNNIKQSNLNVNVDEPNIVANVEYFTTGTNPFIGNGSHPDELIVIFPYGSSTLNSLTITYDC
jgi:hypothetical protein